MPKGRKFGLPLAFRTLSASDFRSTVSCPVIVSTQENKHTKMAHKHIRGYRIGMIRLKMRIKIALFLLVYQQLFKSITNLNLPIIIHI
ncbi:hypothetical protein BACINT_03168 [Bacteroides intestinalis DSM 17393]|uniref:Uncharacterized protein n=1 Tax=Bacteroides intestinalis DSM 17393 TaxID=471870 RepID=B3CI83_9BACE|nr:hypothetical protein BACINT_03168 [Bacteroides intestinalis DSM 17393]